MTKKEIFKARLLFGSISNINYALEKSNLLQRKGNYLCLNDLSIGYFEVELFEEDFSNFSDFEKNYILYTIQSMLYASLEIQENKKIFFDDEKIKSRYFTYPLPTNKAGLWIYKKSDGFYYLHFLRNGREPVYSFNLIKEENSRYPPTFNVMKLTLYKLYSLSEMFYFLTKRL